MKTSTLRVLVPIAIGLVAAIGYATHMEIGSLSSFGWQSISMLCPLGAFTAVVAAKTLVPRAVIALAVACVLAVVLGRAFCGWICPIPVTKRLPELFRKKDPADKAGQADKTGLADKAGQAAQTGQADEADLATTPKTAAKTSCASCEGGCGSAKFDSRHLVLLGSILTATIFGFPVFCLICPIGLSFATIFLVISLFGGGDITWGVILVPALLILEVTVFRKWCSHICPLGAFMSLLNRPNKRVLKPVRAEEACIEAKGGTCGRCAAACEVKIDPRNLAAGTHVSECTTCRACVDACPVHVITLPLLAKADKQVKR